MSDAVEFTTDTFEEFEIVRDSGACNMMDRRCVQAQADIRELWNLSDPTSDSTSYARLLTAFSAWKAGQE
jgi:hypothetical protein